MPFKNDRIQADSLVFRVLDKPFTDRTRHFVVRILWSGELVSSPNTTSNTREITMTFWKVDYLSSEDNTTLTRWFRNSRDAEVFCDGIPGSIYSTNYYCREVVIPNNVLIAAERLWKASPIAKAVPPVPAPVANAYRLAS